MKKIHPSTSVLEAMSSQRQTAFLVLSIFSTWLLTTGLNRAQEKPGHPDKPNIILILDDDLGAQELSCYGNTVHHTPNIDQLAKDGVRFETFYATPLCTPSRFELLTGQYGFRTGYLGMETMAFVPDTHSPEAAVNNHFTIAAMLKARGYATAVVGKWHVEGSSTKAGFEENMFWGTGGNPNDHDVYQAAKAAGISPKERYWHPLISHDEKFVPTTPDMFGPDIFNHFVIDYVHRHKDVPFFIYYASVLTHIPRVPTPDPDHPGQRWPIGLKSDLEYLDYLVGQLRMALKKDGLEKNTYIIFTADNGTSQDGWNGGGKGTVTEQGVRVPAIFTGPNIKPGVVTPALANFPDIMPTLAAWSGGQMPAGTTFDGQSLVPVLEGKTDKAHNWVYSYLDDGRVLRDNRWLLQIDRGQGPTTFFDCGDYRHGMNYKDVTAASADSTSMSAEARKNFARILATMPMPTPRPGVLNDSAHNRDNFNKLMWDAQARLKKQNSAAGPD